MFILTTVAAAGCAAPHDKPPSSSREVAIADPSSDADAAWMAIDAALRQRRFLLDRVDRAAGVVTTLPETSEQIFEFWRRDVVTARDAWEATLNPIRRWVEVRVARDDARSWARISVVVHKERLSSPDRQFNSTGAAHQFFGDSLPSTTGHYRVTAKDDRWLDIGRDAALEDALLREITERCPALRPASTAAPQ